MLKQYHLLTHIKYMKKLQARVYIATTYGFILHCYKNAAEKSNNSNEKNFIFNSTLIYEYQFQNNITFFSPTTKEPLPLRLKAPYK